MAGSREAAETMQAMVAAWGDAARGMLRAFTIVPAGHADDGSARHAGTVPATRTAPADAAPDAGRTARDADTGLPEAIERLGERLAGLERRLERLEQEPRKPARAKRPGR